MRILFVSGEYPPMQGGVGDYTHCLGQALVRLGADVHVLTRPPAGRDGARAAAASDEPVVHGMMRGAGWGLWRHVLQLAGELQPDVIHIQYQSAAYDLHPAVNFLPWRLRASRRIAEQRSSPAPAGRRGRQRPAILTTFHDLREPYMFPKAGPLRWQAVLAMARQSDAAVVTNPEDWALLARDAPQLAPRMWPIPIGSNIDGRPPAGYERAGRRAAWDAGPDDWLLAYFGFLNRNKGGEALIRALDALVAAGRPARLIMVGGQTGSSDPTNVAYLSEIKALIEALKLAGRVAWTGFTPDEEVSANLLAADCAVLPYCQGASLRHGSLMAALAHGLPIVTTFNPAAKDEAAKARFARLDDGISASLVRPNDPRGLAEAVTSLMTNTGLRCKLAAGARDLARQFEWDTIAQQHMEAYRAACQYGAEWPRP